MPEASRRLQLGAFNQAFDGWVNTDITRHITVARVPGLAAALFRVGRMSRDRYEDHRRGVFRRMRRVDVTKRFPFGDGSFDYVFASHLLEHLYPGHAEFCVREAHRVLAPGGILRVVVPDLDLHVAEFHRDDPAEFLDFVYRYRLGPTRPGVHRFAYNERNLGELLSRAGFRSVIRRGYREGRCADVERIDTRPRSLFMEAEK